MKIIFCGSREWLNRDTIKFVMQSLKDNLGTFTVIEGEARGADSMARSVAEELKLPIEKYPADWDRYGKGAGHIRNSAMLKEGRADAVVAFQLNHSRGTQHMIDITYMAKKPLWVNSDGVEKFCEFILALKQLQKERVG